VSDLQTIVNNSNRWLRFRNWEKSENNITLGPESSASFEIRPWIPHCNSQADFNAGHYWEFNGSGIGGSWFLYERSGLIRARRGGFESGATPASFPPGGHAPGWQLYLAFARGDSNGFALERPWQP
jgi:hypothetical protein